jgi:tRNA(Ile)-lysidine synthase
MRPVTADGIIRPLLCTSRSEVRLWAEKHGLRWREDSSNADHRFARNLLRNEVLPELAREFNRNLEGILAGTADIAAAEEDYWKGQVGPLYRSMARRCGLGVLIDVAELTRKHTAVQRRLIREGVAQVRGDLRSIDQQHVEAVLHVCGSSHGHDRVIIPGVDATRSFGLLLLAKPGELSAEPRNYSIDLTWNEKITLPFGAGEIELEVVNSDGKICVNVNKERQFPTEIADLDIEALSSPAVRLQVRNWRPGDGLLRAGHQKPEKIKSLFQESQVFLWERRHWPVAVANDDVFWVRKFGAAAAYAAKPGSSNLARLSYLPRLELSVL